MNCQSCNTKIDYLFLTDCAECGGAIQAAGASRIQPLPEVPPVESFQRRLTWKRRLGNLVYLLASSIAGMVSGAVALYMAFALFCITILNHLDRGKVDPSVACARGTYITFLTIMIGAFLGTMGGSVLAVKRPLFKAEIN